MNKKVDVNVDSIVLVPIEKIRPNPDQPRMLFDQDELQRLRVSMVTEGQIVPIFLKPVNDENAQRDDVEYELVDGERRWQSAMMEGSGITHLKAIVREYDSLEQYRKACALNFNRMGHTPYEEIYMCWKLVVDHTSTLNYVANILGKSTTWVNQRVLAYQRLDPFVMECVKQGKVPISVATYLSRLLPADQIRELNQYLHGGGTIGDIVGAVRTAADNGRVQGSVRKPDLLDDRRYVLRSADELLKRFGRHHAMGEQRLMAVVTSMQQSQRDELIRKLSEAGREIVNLMRLLKSEDF